MQLKRLGKRGVLEHLSQIAVGAGSVAIVLVVTFLVLSNIDTTIGTQDGVTCSNTSTDAGGGGTSIACNASNTVKTALSDNVVGFVGLIILVAVAGLLIALVRKGLR